MIEHNEDRDVLRGLSNAVIGWRQHQDHDLKGFDEVDEWLRKAEDILRRAGYFGDNARDAFREDASGIDI
ncbi:MAG: hypothetical protein V3S07_00890 [Micropepsaceae bacterium]